MGYFNTNRLKSTSEVSKKAIIYFPNYSESGIGSMNAYVKDLRRICLDFGFITDILAPNVISNKVGRLFSAFINYLWGILYLNLKRSQVIIFISQEFILPVVGKKCIVVCHDLIQLKYPRSKFIKWKVILNLIIIKLFSYKVIVPSRSTKLKLKKVFNIDAEIIENVIEIKYTVNGNLGLSSVHDGKKPKILWIGTNLVHKGLDDILNVAHEFPDYSFILILPKSNKIDISTRTNVCVLSNLSEDQLYYEFSTSALFITTSYDEGFNRPLHEAIQFGIPVMARSLGVYYHIEEKIIFFRSQSELIEYIKTFNFKLSENPKENLEYSNYAVISDKYLRYFKSINL